MLVVLLASAGVMGMAALTVSDLIALGLLLFGKVPTSWSGTPLPLTMRCVELQLQLAVLFILTEALLLKAL